MLQKVKHKQLLKPQPGYTFSASGRAIEGWVTVEYSQYGGFYYIPGVLCQCPQADPRLSAAQKETLVEL